MEIRRTKHTKELAVESIHNWSHENCSIIIEKKIFIFI